MAEHIGRWVRFTGLYPLKGKEFVVTEPRIVEPGQIQVEGNGQEILVPLAWEGKFFEFIDVQYIRIPHPGQGGDGKDGER